MSIEANITLWTSIGSAFAALVAATASTLLLRHTVQKAKSDQELESAARLVVEVRQQEQKEFLEVFVQYTPIALGPVYFASVAVKKQLTSAYVEEDLFDISSDNRGNFIRTLKDPQPPKNKTGAKIRLEKFIHYGRAQLVELEGLRGSAFIFPVPDSVLRIEVKITSGTSNRVLARRIIEKL